MLKWRSLLSVTHLEILETKHTLCANFFFVDRKCVKWTQESSLTKFYTQLNPPGNDNNVIRFGFVCKCLHLCIHHKIRMARTAYASKHHSLVCLCPASVCDMYNLQKYVNRAHRTCYSLTGRGEVPPQTKESKIVSVIHIEIYINIDAIVCCAYKAQFIVPFTTYAPSYAHTHTYTHRLYTYFLWSLWVNRKISMKNTWSNSLPHTHTLSDTHTRTHGFSLYLSSEIFNQRANEKWR